MQYGYQNSKVHFIGSIAHYYSTLLKEVATEKGITIGKIEQSPIGGLVEYHNNQLDSQTKI